MMISSALPIEATGRSPLPLSGMTDRVEAPDFAAALRGVQIDVPDQVFPVVLPMPTHPAATSMAPATPTLQSTVVLEGKLPSPPHYDGEGTDVALSSTTKRDRGAHFEAAPEDFPAPRTVAAEVALPLAVAAPQVSLASDIKTSLSEECGEMPLAVEPLMQARLNVAGGAIASAPATLAPEFSEQPEPMQVLPAPVPYLPVPSEKPLQPLQPLQPSRTSQPSPPMQPVQPARPVDLCMLPGMALAFPARSNLMVPDAQAVLPMAFPSPMTPPIAEGEGQEKAAAKPVAEESFPSLATAFGLIRNDEVMTIGLAAGTGASQHSSPLADVASTPTLPVVDINDSDRWIAEMARDIAVNRRDDGTLSFRLLPAHLGRLDVTMQSGVDGVAIKLAAANETATNLLVVAQSRLVEELRHNGVRVVATDVGGFSSATSSDRQNDSRDQWRGQQTAIDVESIPHRPAALLPDRQQRGPERLA